MDNSQNKFEQDFITECLKIHLHNNGDCHHNSKQLFTALKKLGYPVKLKTGIFFREDNQKIKHSWVEYEDKILEQDCRQLHIASKNHYKIISDIKTKQRFVEVAKWLQQTI